MEIHIHNCAMFFNENSVFVSSSIEYTHSYTHTHTSDNKHYCYQNKKYLNSDNALEDVECPELLWLTCERNRCLQI